MAQFIVVVEVFITHRQTKDPLPNQRLDLTLNQIGTTTVGKAAGKPFDNRRLLEPIGTIPPAEA